MVFEPDKQILSLNDLFVCIGYKTNDIIVKVYEIVKEQIPIRCSKNLDHVLSSVVEALSKDHYKKCDDSRITFDIEKKIQYNKLNILACWIYEYSCYCPHLNSIYSAYETEGKDAALLVRERLNDYYVETLCNLKDIDADSILLEIKRKIMMDVRQSQNCPDFLDEDLDISAKILITDSFINCRIFKKPE